MTSRFGWYLVTPATWLTGFGVQTIVFPWLLAVALRALVPTFPPTRSRRWRPVAVASGSPA